MCKLAYRGLFKENSKLVFTDDEVGERFEHLGLLSEVKEMYVSEGPPIHSRIRAYRTF